MDVGGEDWHDTLTSVVSYELCISNENVEKLRIEAHLYKVLLYEQGGHFKPHKDTVKEEGMFGTLVLQLPSEFKGSNSIVSHQGQTKEFELSADCDSKFRYMAFYGDCEHEILPVEEGWRFCLVYNLVVTKPNPNGVVPDARSMESTVVELQLEAIKWMTSSTGKLGYCLDHEYTLDSFDFGKLKGRDAVVLSALRHAKDDTEKRLFDISLVIFYHSQSYDDNEYGVEKILLEDGQRNPKSPVWCDSLLYPSKDGFIKELDDLSDEESDAIDKARKYGELEIGSHHVAFVDHHDVGNEGGGYTTL